MSVRPGPDIGELKRINPQPMYKKLLISVALTAGVVGLVIAAYIFKPEREPLTSDYFRVELIEPQSNSPTQTYTGYVRIRGRASKPAIIEFSRGDKIFFQTETDNQGNFDVENLVLTPGLNDISCTATSKASSRENASVSVRITWEPAKPPVPTLDALPPVINSAEIVIKGTSFPDASVTIEARPALPTRKGTRTPGAIPFKKDVTAGADGRFSTSVRLLGPAKYEISAISLNSQGATSAQSEKIVTTYDPYWYPSSGDAVAEPAALPSRKATFAISHKRLSISFEVVMARDDPSVKALLANEMPLWKFFDDIFDLKLNGSHYTKLFRAVEPQIRLTDKVATISAARESFVNDAMPILNGMLTLSMSPLASSRDSLTIVTNDYVVKSFAPTPTTLENNTATWVGHDDPQLTKAELREVNLQLRYSPLSSPGRAIRFLRLNPQSLWAYPANIAPTLLYGVFNAIPIFWILLFLKRISEQLPGDQTTFAALLTITPPVLAVLSLVDTVSDVANGVAYLLFQIRFLATQWSTAPELLQAGSLVVFIVFSVAQVLVVRSKANWAEWLRAICRAIRYAALINVALLMVFRIVARYPRLLMPTKVLIGFAVLLLILIFISQLAKDVGIRFKHPRWLAGFALLLIALLSIPFGEAAQNDFPGFDVLFYMVRDLAPAVAAFVLVAFLKSMSDAGREDASDWMAQAALIIFCGYLVGATTTLFMIPIPFLLSFFVFRRFVISSADAIQRLAAVEASVFQSRRDLIDKVIANDAAQDMKNNVEKLGDKVVSGDLKIDEFKTRANEIEAYAGESERAATLAGNVPAEDAVLGVGIEPQRWRNAIWAVKFGALLSLPFLVVYLAELLIRGNLLFGEYYWLLIVLTRIVTFLADWLIGAFFFGYFFKSIQGNSGLKKGLRVGCAVILCLLPVWFISTTSGLELLAIFLRAGQTFLFFTFLGLASDYKVFKDTMSHGFRWRLFTRFGDMPSFTAVASVVITTIGVTLTTVLTGQFKDLVAQLVGTALNQPAPHP